MQNKITFPHAGEYYVVFKDLFKNLGYEVIVPPMTSQKTLDIGVKYAPEQACLPFKITLGNIIEGVERGANIVAMIGGKTGICRLAYYGQMYGKILEGNGYSVMLLPVKVKKEFWENVKKNNPNLKFSEFIKILKIFWFKLKAFELIREKSLELRPFENNKGECTRVKKNLIKKLEQLNDRSELKKFKNQIVKEFNAIPIDPNKKVIRIGLVGEFFLLIDQFSTMNLEEFLGENGVVLKPSLSFVEFFIGSLKQIRALDKIFPTHRKKVNNLSRKYINRPIGGHGMQSVGESINFSKLGYDGVIHLYPFSCMPEVVASSVLPRASADAKIPILSMCLDEHTGQAGFHTRVEAFIDMIRRKKING